MGDSKDLNVVGVEFLKKNGIDVDELVKQLVINSSVEFTAYYYFTLLRANCTGMEGEGIKGVIEDARLEDLVTLNHALKESINLEVNFLKMPLTTSKCLAVNFFSCLITPTDLKAILEKCLKAEQGCNN